MCEWAFLSVHVRIENIHICFFQHDATRTAVKEFQNKISAYSELIENEMCLHTVARLLQVTGKSH